MLQHAGMKKREIFSHLTVPNIAIVRIDGRRFGTSLRQLQFTQPYDIRLAKGMADSTEAFFKKSGFNPSLAYLFSDEINLLFVHDLPFNGRLEKIDSIIPSFFSSALVIYLGSPQPLSFDSRVTIIDTSDIINYLSWRQEECWRNVIHSYGYYLLRDEGITSRQAAERLKGMDSKDLHELAWTHGINLAVTPSWQRRGILVYRQQYAKPGLNQVTEEKTRAKSTAVIQDWDIPIFKNKTGVRLIKSILQSTTS